MHVQALGEEDEYLEVSEVNLPMEDNIYDDTTAMEENIYDDPHELTPETTGILYNPN